MRAFIGPLTACVVVSATGVAWGQARSAADGPWSGWVQCELTAQLNEQGRSYSNQQTHTWVLTATTPTSGTDIKDYPALWTVVGGGTSQRQEGNGRTVADKWTTSGQPLPTTISFRVDLTGALFIAQRGNQLHGVGAMTGMSVAHSINGNAPDQQTPMLALTIDEFRFPLIREDGTKTSITGSTGPSAVGAIASGQPPRTVSNAGCSWNFVRGGGSPPPPPSGRSITRDQAAPLSPVSRLELPGTAQPATPTIPGALPGRADAGPSQTTTPPPPRTITRDQVAPQGALAGVLQPPPSTGESTSRTQPVAPPVQVAPPSLAGLAPAAGQPGDAVTLTGSGFGSTPGEVHFILNPGKDVVAQVDQWTDGMIKAHVPGARCVLPSPASAYVVAHGTASTAQPFQFTPTLATRTYLLNLFTPGTFISYPGALLPSEQLSEKWLAGTTWVSNIPFGSPAGVRHKNSDPLIGYKGSDTFLAGVTLSNAWVIDDVKFSLFHAVYGKNADASVESFAKGTNVPAVRVHWWTDLLNPFDLSAGDVSYTLAVVLKGPADMPDGLITGTPCR